MQLGTLIHRPMPERAKRLNLSQTGKTAKCPIRSSYSCPLGSTPRIPTLAEIIQSSVGLVSPYLLSVVASEEVPLRTAARQFTLAKTNRLARKNVSQQPPTA